MLATATPPFKNHRRSFSYRAARAQVPTEIDPYKLYTLFFGVGAGLAPGQDAVAVAMQRLRHQRTVLDYVAGDLQALRARVGSAERRQLEAHETALREMERRLGATLLPDAGRPAVCGGVRGPAQGLDLRAEENVPALIDVMLDFLALALACRLVRVVTFQFGHGGEKWYFKWLGINQNSHDDIAHKDNGATPEITEKLVRINRWYAERVASLARALRSHPRGGRQRARRIAHRVGQRAGDGAAHDHRHPGGAARHGRRADQAAGRARVAGDAGLPAARHLAAERDGGAGAGLRRGARLRADPGIGDLAAQREAREWRFPRRRPRRTIGALMRTKLTGVLFLSLLVSACGSGDGEPTPDAGEEEVDMGGGGTDVAGGGLKDMAAEAPKADARDTATPDVATSEAGTEGDVATPADAADVAAPADVAPADVAPPADAAPADVAPPADARDAGPGVDVAPVGFRRGRCPRRHDEQPHRHGEHRRWHDGRSDERWGRPGLPGRVPRHDHA